MLRQELDETLHRALSAFLLEQGVYPAELNGSAQLNLEIPKHRHFGDFAVNVSSLARVLKKAPPQIAEAFMASLMASPQAVGLSPSLAGGFVNFKLDDARLMTALTQTVRAQDIGANTALKDTTCLLEFVSANPTGPLHIGHGRWVALGDSLARLMTHCGAVVTKEFYLNDAGVQMNNIAMSIWYRCLEALNTGVSFPMPVEGKKFAFYSGEYVTEIAIQYLAEHKTQVEQWWQSSQSAENPPEEAIQAFKALAKSSMLAEQMALMERCRLTFDHVFSETSLYEANLVEQAVETLGKNGQTYEKDGALWLKTTDFGDDQDRVIRKTTGEYTYLMPDIAYHDEKYSRQNPKYNRFINIWGADHHGYIPRIKAGIAGMGYPVEQFEVILGQLVNLILDGAKTRMGKRKTMVTLGDLVDEVGVDSVRFWMIAKSADTAVDFDVDLAVSQSNENPVFYVQYAHARCCSILRNAMAPATQPDGPPWTPLDETDWQDFLKQVNPNALATLFTDLENPDAAQPLRELILRLDSFEEKIIDAAKNRSPHLIARYAQDLAADFHQVYNLCRILSPDLTVRKQRLVVVLAIKNVLAKALELLGVSAPESM